MLDSELNYYIEVDSYYKNLNRLGMFYEKLDYNKAMPFLLMLPNSFFIIKKSHGLHLSKYFYSGRSIRKSKGKTFKLKTYNIAFLKKQ